MKAWWVGANDVWYRDSNAGMSSMGNGGGMRGGGAVRGRGGRGVKDDGKLDALCAGRKPDREALPLAKGFAEELDKSMFWDECIV